MGLDDLLDAPIFSSVVKVRKPDPRIYLLACERLSVAPGACLFVGDGGSRELSGAAVAGMTPVCIRSATEDGYDAHRVDAEIWHGPSIKALQEVLAIVDGSMV